MQHITSTVTIKRRGQTHRYYHDTEPTSELTTNIEFLLMTSVLRGYIESTEIREHIDTEGVIRKIDYIITLKS